MKYALDKLHAIPNVYNYIDIGHSGWLGWDSNAGPAATLFAEVAKSTTAGFASVDGFVSDVANTTPLNEPFLPDSSISVGGTPIRSSDFYQWNFDFDEADFTAHMYRLLVAAGFPSSLGMLIDTSRNGWGGPNRPTAVSTSTDVNTYVDQSRVDRRVHRGAWCNPMGAGIGELPQASPSGYTASHLDAFVWIKPPGESDGASSDIPNDQGKRFDRMCDPTFVSPKLENQLTGATPNAPLAGQWFEDQFKTLVANAYPVIQGGGTNPGRHDGALGADGSDCGHADLDDRPAVVDRVDRQRGRDRLRRLPRHHAGGHLHLDELHRDRPDRRDRVLVHGPRQGRRRATSRPPPPPSPPPPRPASVTDTTAPSVPTGLTAGTTTTDAVPLSWTASTDNAGGTGVAGLRGLPRLHARGHDDLDELHRDRPDRRHRVLVHGQGQGPRGQRLGRVGRRLGHHADGVDHGHDGALGADGSDGRHHHLDVGPAVLDRVDRQRGRHRLRRLQRQHAGGLLHHDELHRDRPRGRHRVLVHGQAPRTPPGTSRQPPPAVSATTKTGPRRRAAARSSYTANSWNTGFTGSIKLTNTGTTALQRLDARLLVRQRSDRHAGLERRLVAVRCGGHGEERRRGTARWRPETRSTSGSTARTRARTTRPPPSR